MTLRVVPQPVPVDANTTTHDLLCELVSRRVGPDEARRRMRKIIRLRDKGKCTSCRGSGCLDCCYDGSREMQRIGNKAERDAIKSGDLIRCACKTLTTSDHVACRGCGVAFHAGD